MTGKLKKKTTRLVSAFTLFTFLLQQLSVSLPMVQAGTAPVFEKLPAPSIDLPSGIGKIEEVKAGETRKIIFHIQDAHGNEDAQKNIQAILEYLTSHHDQKMILLEGGNGKLRPELLNFFPKNPELNLKIADSLLKKAELTGAEKFLLQSSSGLTGGSNLGPRLKHSGTTTKNVVAYGIENIAAYRENRQAFQKVLRARTKTGSFLSEMDDQIQRLAAPRLNVLLKNFLKKSEDHETGRIDFTHWLLFLKEQGKKYLSIDLDDPFYQREWPMLIRLFRLHANENKIQQSAIASEKEAFLSKLQELPLTHPSPPRGEGIGKFRELPLPPGEGWDEGKTRLIERIKVLLEKPSTANKTSSQFPLEEALQAFGELLEALPRDFSFKPYENLRLQIQSQILQSELKSDLLSAETEHLESLVMEKLIRNETEKKLVGLYKNYGLLKKLFRLELTLKEYQFFVDSTPSKTDSSSPHVFRRGSSSGFPTKAFPPEADQPLAGGNDGSLRPSNLIRQFAELNADSRVKNVSFSHLDEIDKLFDLALSFYTGARKRDGLMANNALKVIQHFKQDSAILVTGGFHSEGMKEYFESKGFSYYLITPNIQEIGDNKAYLTAMLEGMSSSNENSRLSSPNDRPRLSSPNAFIGDPNWIPASAGMTKTKSSHIALMSKLQARAKILAEAGPAYGNHLTGLVRAELRTIPDLSGIDTGLLAHQYHLQIARDLQTRSVNVRYTPRSEARSIPSETNNITVYHMTTLDALPLVLEYGIWGKTNKGIVVSEDYWKQYGKNRQFYGTSNDIYIPLVYKVDSKDFNIPAVDRGWEGRIKTIAIGTPSPQLIDEVRDLDIPDDLETLAETLDRKGGRDLGHIPADHLDRELTLQTARELVDEGKIPRQNLEYLEYFLEKKTGTMPVYTDFLNDQTEFFPFPQLRILLRSGVIVHHHGKFYRFPESPDSEIQRALIKLRKHIQRREPSVYYQIPGKAEIHSFIISYSKILQEVIDLILTGKLHAENEQVGIQFPFVRLVSNSDNFPPASRSEIRKNYAEILKKEGERKPTGGKRTAGINASFSSSEDKGQWQPRDLLRWAAKKGRVTLSTNPFYGSFLASIFGGRMKTPNNIKTININTTKIILFGLSPVNIFVAMLAPSTTGTRLKSIFPNSYRLNGVNITALISKLFVLVKYIFINNQSPLAPLAARSEARSSKSKAISPEDARHASWQEKMAAADMAAAPEVLKHYSIGTVKKISPASFGLGEHGKALLVESNQGKYILKPLTTALYPELIDGARYEVSVVNELVRKGFPAAPLIPAVKPKTASKEDRFFVEAANGKIYLLYRFVEGKSVSYEKMNRPQFNAFVDTLASFHQTLSAFKPARKRSRPSITDFHVQKERLDQLKALLLRKQMNAKTPLSRGEKFFLDQVDFILGQLSVLNLNLPPPVYKKLPKAKIDGDYHPGNVVFQGNRVLAVFDWDHLREETRIYDFFNEIFPNITSDKRFNVPALLRTVARYEKTQPLNKVEKEMLPEMARLKFLDLATWIVRPEKISERHQYDLSAISSLEQAIAILDRNDHVFAWFQDNLAVLKDIDQRIREGSFKISRSEARVAGERPDTGPGTRQPARAEMRQDYTKEEIGDRIASTLTVLKNSELPGGIKNKIQDIQENRLFQEGGVAYIPQVKGGELIVVGDQHGDLATFEALLHQSNALEKLRHGEPIYLAFLGDYVDGGYKSVELLMKIMELKIQYPDRILLMRGNHEEKMTDRMLDALQRADLEHRQMKGKPFTTFMRNVTEKYGPDTYDAFFQLFEALPSAAVTGNGIVLGHAGPPVEKIESLRDLVGNQTLLMQMRNNYMHAQENASSPDIAIVSESQFDAFMAATGGSVFVRGHDDAWPPQTPFFNGRLETIITHGGGSPDAAFFGWGQRVDIIQRRFAVLPLDTPLQTIPPEATYLITEARTDYAALESRAKDLASAFRRQKQVERADEKLNELIREWIQHTPPAQKVSFPEEGVLGFKNAESGFTFWHDLADSVQNSSFEQKTAALAALEALLTAAHIFYTQKAKQNERNRGTRLFYYDHALQPLLVLRTLSPSAENLHDLAVNYFHSDELSRAEQIGFELLHQSDLSRALTRAVNVLIGYIKVKKAWQYYQKARQSTGSEEDAKILYRQAADLARDGVSVFGVVLREYRLNPQDSRQIARAWTGLSSIEQTFILSTQELLKMEKSRKTAASMRLKITGRAVQALHAAVQSLLTAKARGNDASYQHSLEKSYLPLWNEENTLDKILDGFVREGVGTLEDRPIQVLQKNLEQLEILLKGKTLWNENYNPVVPAADPKVQHLLAQIQILRDWINFREETKQKITQHAKDLASGDYAEIDSFKKELELFVVEDLKTSPALAKIPEPASHENRLREFFQDVYAAFADLSLEELYVLKHAVVQSTEKKSESFHADDMAEITKSANDDLGLLVENHVPLTLEVAARMIQTPFFKLAGFSLQPLPPSQIVPPPAEEKQAIVPYRDTDVLNYGENDLNRFKSILEISKKLGPWVGPARTAATQKIQGEAQKQLDFFLAAYQKWKKHLEADRKSPDRLPDDQARWVKKDLVKYRMGEGYYPLMMELDRMNKNDLAFVQTYLQTGHPQGREAGTTLQKEEDAPMANSPLLYHGLARIRHYQDFIKAFYRHTGFSWAAIAIQEMNEIEQTLLRIRDSEKDPDYLSFEAYQTEIQKANGIYLEIKDYQQVNGVKIEKMLATVTALKETLGKARELALAPEQKAIFESSLVRLGTRAEAVSRRLQNIPRDPGYWDRTQEAKRMAVIAEKLLSQAAFLLKGAQRIQELQKNLRSQKELQERDGLTLEPSSDSPDNDWFQKTKTAGEELAAAQKLFSGFQEERFDEKKTGIFRSKLADLDQKISPVLETITKLTAEIAQIKKDRIFEETGKVIKLWKNFIESFILKVFPGENSVKKSWLEINRILSGFGKEPQNPDFLMEIFFRLLDAIDKAIEIDDYQKIKNFQDAAAKIISQSSHELQKKIQEKTAALFFSVRKTAYGMPQEPQITMNPENIKPEGLIGRAALINASYAFIAAQKIFAPWSSFDNEHFLRAYRHELLSFALTFSFYAQMLEGRQKGYPIPDAHAVLEKNFALAFERQRDYLESKKELPPSYLSAFDQVRRRAEKEPMVPQDFHSPLSGPLEQRLEAVFNSFAPEEIFRRIDFTQSLIKAEDSRREIPEKIIQELLAKVPQIDSDLLRQSISDIKEHKIPEAGDPFEKIIAIFAKHGIPLEPGALENTPFVHKIVSDILRELDRRQSEKDGNVIAEVPPEFKIPVNAGAETVDKFKKAVILLEKGSLSAQEIEEIIRLARIINPAFKTRFEAPSLAAASPEDKARLFLEIQWQVLLPLNLITFNGQIWPVRSHTWKKQPDSYGHPWWSVEVTAPPDAIDSFYASPVFFRNSAGSLRVSDSHFRTLWVVTGKLPSSPVLKDKIRQLMQLEKITKDNYYKRIYLPGSLEMVRKEIGDYIYSNLRRSDDFFSTEPLGEYLTAFEILRKTSPLYEGLSAIPRQVSRIEQEVLPLLSFSNNLRVLLSLMRETLRQKDPALAYLYFLIYLYTMLNELEKAPRAAPAVTLHTTFFKDLAREAGIALENPDVLPADERLKVLNAFTGAFLEKIENGEGIKGLHAPEQALQFLERIYAKHFWTEAERLERLNSKAGPSEPSSEEISPAAAMIRQAYQPPAASPKTIGAVIEILRAVSAQQEPFASASLQIMDTRLEEIAKSSPEVNIVQASAIVKGMLRPFMSQKSKPNLPAEIKNLETYPAIKMKVLLTRIWAVFFAFYLEEFQDKESLENQESSDRETLLQLARAIDPRLADSFQEFTVLMLQPQEGKTLADLPPASVISKILAPWRDSSSGEDLQKAILYAFNYFLYPAGMLLARFPSDAVAGRFTPMLYFIRSDFDLNLIHLGAHTQWSLAGSPVHYGRLEAFTTPLIPGTAIDNKTLEKFSQEFALWLRPELFTGPTREAALKKSDKILGHSFSEKMRQSPLSYSPDPETIAGLDSFFAALKKKAFSGASPAKSGEELVERIKIHRARFQTVLELYRNISREREWGKRFGEEKTKSLRLLFSLMIAGNHFPSVTLDEFHDFLFDFAVTPDPKDSLGLLNALLPETAPLAGESDPKRRTEQLAKILNAIDLEKLSLGLLRERAPVFMQETFGEDLFKDFQEMHIRAPLAQITNLEKDAPPFVRSETRVTNSHWKSNMPQEGPLPVLSPPGRESVLESFEKFVLFKNGNEQDLQILIQQAIFETWFAMNRDIQGALRAGGEKIEANELVLAGELCHGACTKANQDFQRRLNSLTNMLQDHPLEIFSHSALDAFKGSYRHAFTVVRFKGSDKMVLVDPTLRQFFDRNFQKGWLEPIQNYFNREENRYVKEALLRDGFIPLDEKVARIYAAAFRGGKEMEINLPFFTKSTFRSYLFAEMPSLVDTSLGSFDQFLPEIASQRRWIDGGRSEARRASEDGGASRYDADKWQQYQSRNRSHPELPIGPRSSSNGLLVGGIKFTPERIISNRSFASLRMTQGVFNTSQTQKIAQILMDGIIPGGKFFDAVFKAIFGERIAAAQTAKIPQAVLQIKIEEALRNMGNPLAKQAAVSASATDDSFAVTGISVSKELSVPALEKTLGDFVPLSLKNNPHKILILAYSGNLPRGLAQRFYENFGRKVFVFGGANVFKKLFRSDFSGFDAEQKALAKLLLPRANALARQAHAPFPGPLKMADLKDVSLVAADNAALNELDIARQFLDEDIRDIAADLAIKLVELPKARMTAAELIKNQPDQYTAAGSPNRFTFTSGFRSQLTALAEAFRSARHILEAA